MPPGRVAVSLPLVGQDSNLVVRPVLPKTLRTIPTSIVYDNVTQCFGHEPWSGAMRLFGKTEQSAPLVTHGRGGPLSATKETRVTQRPQRYAPTCERLRGDFLVERNSFRCSVPLVPFERANRSAEKKRNEFRSTAPRLPTPRGSRRAGRMAIGRSACSFAVAHATEAGLESNGRSDH